MKLSTSKTIWMQLLPAGLIWPGAALSQHQTLLDRTARKEDVAIAS
jgi:hypothetical protein